MTTAITILALGIVAAFLLFLAVGAIAACMLSSRISRAEERGFYEVD